MSTSSGKTLLVVIRRRKLSVADEGRRICTEFKQAKYPFKWRRYMCARCGVLREEHSASKSKLSAGDEGEHITGKSKLSAGDEGERIAGKSKLSAEDEGEHSANKSKLSAGEEGERVCTEFKQAKYPFKWRKYMCARCGVLHSKHCISKAKAKAKADNSTKNIREEHLTPRKRLILRFKRSQALAAAAREKEKEKEKEGELEEGEITSSPGAAITKGKRASRRKRVDTP